MPSEVKSYMEVMREQYPIHVSKNLEAVAHAIDAKIFDTAKSERWVIVREDGQVFKDCIAIVGGFYHKVHLEGPYDMKPVIIDQKDVIRASLAT